MIKIAPRRVNIQPDFKDALLGMYARYLSVIQEQSGDDRERRKQLLERYPQASMRALDAVKGINEARRGLMYEYTRFEIAYEYTRLYTIKRNVTFLCGDTKPIVITGKNKRTGIQQSWKIGVYTVAFDVADLASGKYANCHFVPNESPMTEDRHPHHSATNNYASSFSKNPLDMDVTTCWGGFSSGISFAVLERDISALFSMVFKYLSRYDSESVLGHGGNQLDRWSSCGVENIEWMQDVNSRT